MVAVTPHDEKGREQVRMRVTLAFDYLAPIDAEVYEGTTDPVKMAAIDAQNSPEALVEFAGRRPVLVDITPVLDGAPSLPAGGGDGRAEVWLTWGWSGDDEYTLLGVHATREGAQAHLDRAEPVEVEGPYGSDTHAELDGMCFRGLEGPDRREVVGAASSAGDEARTRVREAIEALHSRTDLHDRAIQEAAKAADAVLAYLSSPLPGAGDGRAEWRIVAADGTPRSEGSHSTPESLGPPSEWDDDFLGGPHRLQRRTITASAWTDEPAPLSGVEQTKETTR